MRKIFRRFFSEPLDKKQILCYNICRQGNGTPKGAIKNACYQMYDGEDEARTFEKKFSKPLDKLSKL